MAKVFELDRMRHQDDHHLFQLQFPISLAIRKEQKRKAGGKYILAQAMNLSIPHHENARESSLLGLLEEMAGKYFATRKNRMISHVGGLQCPKS